MQFAPSLFCADPLNLERDIRALDALAISWHHVDIMDGHFVPNLAIGIETALAICKNAKKPVYLHLMVERPSDYVPIFAKSGAAAFTFHLESTFNPFRVASLVKETGMKCGVAINPITPVERIKPLLSIIDLVTIMTIEPGFSGQKFIPTTLDKIKDLRKLADDAGSKLVIEIDGGITPENAPRCIDSGADVLVGGTFTIFQKGGSLEENFNKIIPDKKSSVF